MIKSITWHAEQRSNSIAPCGAVRIWLVRTYPDAFSTAKVTHLNFNKAYLPWRGRRPLQLIVFCCLLKSGSLSVCYNVYIFLFVVFGKGGLHNIHISRLSVPKILQRLLASPVDRNWVQRHVRRNYQREILPRSITKFDFFPISRYGILSGIYKVFAIAKSLATTTSKIRFVDRKLLPTPSYGNWIWAVILLPTPSYGNLIWAVILYYCRLQAKAI